MSPNVTSPRHSATRRDPSDAASNRAGNGDRPARAVLMVLFYFPPLGGVSMSRNVRNVEYLPRHGWTPVVLTSRDAGGPLDPDALALVPPTTTVIRARSLEPQHLRRAVMPLLTIAAGFRQSRLLPARSASRDGNGATSAGPGAPRAPSANRHAPRWLWRVHGLLSFPDSQVGWLPFAVRAGIRAARTRSFDAVYSTSPPVTAHLVAGIIARLGRSPVGGRVPRPVARQPHHRGPRRATPLAPPPSPGPARALDRSIRRPDRLRQPIDGTALPAALSRCPRDGDHPERPRSKRGNRPRPGEGAVRPLPDRLDGDTRSAR